jgi:ribosomal protein L7/L12
MKVTFTLQEVHSIIRERYNWPQETVIQIGKCTIAKKKNAQKVLTVDEYNAKAVQDLHVNERNARNLEAAIKVALNEFPRPDQKISAIKKLRETFVYQMDTPKDTPNRTSRLGLAEAKYAVESSAAAVERMRDNGYIYY